MMGVVQVIIIVFMPYIWMRFARHFQVESWLSPVVLCYVTGILLANQSLFSLNQVVSQSFVEGTIVLAIPLLLYSTDIIAWWKHAKSSVLSFVLCVVSGVICSVVVALVFNDTLEGAWQISGMLVGVYTGGTPNMNAIGVALEVSSETLVLMNAADIFCGGIYLVFLTSVAHRFFAKLLPAFAGDKNISEDGPVIKKPITVSGVVKLFFLTLLIVGLSVGMCYLFYGKIDNLAFILLMLTSLSVVASLFSKIRNIRGSYEAGEYLLLMFCIAVGMQADFSAIIEDGGFIIAYTAFVLTGTVFLHLLLSRIFKIDVDTMMITATAALYGPVFVGQIASTIKNRTLVFSGMATGLVGYAIGNYLGISVAQILQIYLS